MAENEFVQCEFNQTYEMFRHYLSEQNSILRLFFTIYLGIWGGYILLEVNNIYHLLNLIIVIGFISGLLFVFLLVSNRFYVVVTIKRLEFLRLHFLYTSNIWNKYPQFYPSDSRYEGKTIEKVQMIRSKSTVAIMLFLVFIANAILIYHLRFVCCQTFYDKIKIYVCLIAIAFQLLLTIIICKLRASGMDEKDATDKKRVESK